MYRGSLRLRARLKLSYVASLAALVVALFLLTHHAPRRVVELEMAVTFALLLFGSGAIDTLADQAERSEPLAPLIAIVGTDGSGKSTLSADLRATLAAERNVEVCYLGLGSGDLGNRIKQWPVIGAWLERKLTKKAGQTRSKEQKIPGLPTALVVFAFSLIRLHRFRRVLKLRRRGVTVITDRYPQTEVAGFYDGPGLSAARAGSRLVAWLAERERRLYEHMASYRPDVVLRLNVDADVAYMRKPDHTPALLAEKVRVTPLLRFHGARIVDLDANADYKMVRRQAFERVRPVLARADRTFAAAA